jgi:DNA-binding NarL/FixJ family response regulator
MNHDASRVSSDDDAPKAADPIRVVLIDDHAMVVESLSARLAMDPRIRVAGTANNSDEGLTVALEHKPDVVVLDVHLPGRGAFDLAEDLIAKLPQTRLLFLTGYLADAYLSQALRLGAAGYLMKGEPIQQLTDAVVRAVRGEVTFSPSVRERLAYDPQTRQYSTKSKSPLSSLTGRQLEVLKHLARGESVKEIAKQMHLSQKSVDSHKYRIMNKLNIHDRVELARFAIREGLSSAYNPV